MLTTVKKRVETQRGGPRRNVPMLTKEGIIEQKRCCGRWGGKHKANGGIHAIWQVRWEEKINSWTGTGSSKHKKQIKKEKKKDARKMKKTYKEPPAEKKKKSLVL